MKNQLSREQTPASLKAPKALEKATSKPLRVLVVDDNADLASLLAEMLKMLGHQTQIVHSGLEVLEAAQSFLPDVILLDIGLPGKNGYEVAKSIRRDRLCKHSLLVALTGWDGDLDKQAAAEAGFDVHLSKPLDMNGLAEVLGRVSPRRLGNERTP